MVATLELSLPKINGVENVQFCAKFLVDCNEWEVKMTVLKCRSIWCNHLALDSWCSWSRVQSTAATLMLSLPKMNGGEIVKTKPSGVQLKPEMGQKMFLYIHYLRVETIISRRCLVFIESQNMSQQKCQQAPQLVNLFDWTLVNYSTPKTQERQTSHSLTL